MRSSTTATRRPQTKPDGSCASCTTLLWVTDNGGNSFTGPAVVGNQDINGGIVAFGADDDPVIGTITDTVTGGTFFQAIHPGRYTSTQARIGNTGANEAYYGSLTKVGPQVYMADGDPVSNVFVKRLDSGDGSDIAQWSASTSFPGTEPTIAGGPAGVFVLAKPAFGQAYGVRKIGADMAPGAPTSLSGKDDAVLGELTQDPSGRLIAAWVNRAAGANAGVRLRQATNAANWSDVRPLLPGADRRRAAQRRRSSGRRRLRGDEQVPAASSAPARSSPPRSARPRPPAFRGSATSPAAPATRASRRPARRSASARSSSTPGGVLPQRHGRDARVKVTSGTFRLNGLEDRPGHRRQDPDRPAEAHAEHDRQGQGDPARPGIPEITLWHGELHVDVRAPSGSTLFDFDTSKFASFFEGFPISGKIQVKLEGDGVVIPSSSSCRRTSAG